MGKSKIYLGYCRVSTGEQGESGLGLAAQEKAIREFNDQTLKGTLLEVRKEVASGKRLSRPEFDYVLNKAKQERATILVAKLDRLGRSLGVLGKVQFLGVPILCADSPTDSEMITGVKMVFAQEERRLIGERTKAALAELKRGGKKLGWHNPKIREGFRAAVKARRRPSKRKGRPPKKTHHRTASALAFSESLRPIIETMLDNNYTLRKICNQLNKTKVATPSGRGCWHLRSVARLLKRLNLSRR